MKFHSVVLPLTLPLAVLLAATGCRHPAASGVTKIPLHQVAPASPATTPAAPPLVSVPETPTPPITSAPPIEAPAAAPISTPVPVAVPDRDGHFATTNIDLDKYNLDRAALAAYTVHFKYDSAVVEDAEQDNLTKVAQALVDVNLKLLIEGHCDERGTEEYNRALGERRALALREALDKIAVDPMRVKTLSYGKDKPLDPGHDESAWAKNRRGEFILLRPKNPAAAPAP